MRIRHINLRILSMFSFLALISAPALAQVDVIFSIPGLSPEQAAIVGPPLTIVILTTVIPPVLTLVAGILAWLPLFLGGLFQSLSDIFGSLAGIFG